MHLLWGYFVHVVWLMKMGLMWASIDWNNPVIQTSAVNLTKPKNFSETFADIFSFRSEIFKIQFFSLITDALEGGFYIW